MSDLIKQLKTARQLVSKLAAEGGKNWRMCVPPESTDTDIVLADALDAAIAALSREEARPAEPKVWMCTRRLDGDKRVFDEPFFAFNRAYVEAHPRHDWAPLYAPHAPVESASDKAPEVRLGSYGAAYDGPEVCRAYTYAHQPGNAVASRLGGVTQRAKHAIGGDSIDLGLSLLKLLEDAGFGVFDLKALGTPPRSANDKAAEELESMRARKDAAYAERNALVALLSTLFPAGKAKTAIEGWSEHWHGCVYIDFPWGQGAWHFHDSQAYLFEHLPDYTKGWDGTTTEQKYAAIREAVSGKRLAPIAAAKDGMVSVPRDDLAELARWYYKDGEPQGSDAGIAMYRDRKARVYSALSAAPAHPDSKGGEQAAPGAMTQEEVEQWILDNEEPQWEESGVWVYMVTSEKVRALVAKLGLGVRG